MKIKKTYVSKEIIKLAAKIAHQNDLCVAVAPVSTVGWLKHNAERQRLTAELKNLISIFE